MATPVPVPNQADLAWAAGFFDGEGSTIARALTSRPGYYQLNVTVPQSGRDGVPPLLLRFQRVMLGMGHINGPNDEFIYMLRFNAREEARLVLKLMWPYLGDVKRTQAREAVDRIEAQRALGTYRQRAPRRRAPEPPALGEAVSADVERAWAAGFLDAEGCFGLARAGARRRGPDWYRIRVSASQHGATGVPAAVLLKLRAVLDGIGRIERHGEPDDFRWCAEGASNVERALEVTRPWLGEQKIEDALTALAAFRAQTRLKGNSVRCIRGHEYSYVTVRGGRTRRICRPCARITQRQSRARQGIAPPKVSQRLPPLH